MSNTLCILGREPALSLAELEACAPSWSATITLASREAAVLEHQAPISPEVIHHLGGMTKLGEVVARWAHDGRPSETITTKMTWAWMMPMFSAGRVEFGASVYGLERSAMSRLTKHWLSVKGEVKTSGRPVRYVTSREAQLSTVVVTTNHLIDRGCEFLVLVTDSEVIVARTTAVQDYRAYGRRDFGRPAADAKSGMLPPKVAQVMLNLAQIGPDEILLDPFCGSGTILQEALMMGVSRVLGSDNTTRAVKDTQENIRWLLQEYPKIQSEAEITLTDARQVKQRVDAVVTEPYLGRPLYGHEAPTFLQRQIQELSSLYFQALQTWRGQLRSGGRVVMIWPEFILNGQPTTLPIADDILQLGYVADPLLSEDVARSIGWTDRYVMTYGRPDAKLRRQIRRWHIA